MAVGLLQRTVLHQFEVVLQQRLHQVVAVDRDGTELCVKTGDNRCRLFLAYNIIP